MNPKRLLKESEKFLQGEHTLTESVSKISRAVNEAADEIVENVKDGNETWIQDPQSAIFGQVDGMWPNLGFPYGQISRWPKVPKSNILVLLGNVFEYVDKVAWLADDSGLWDGLHPIAAVGSMAFFSLENALREITEKKLKDALRKASGDAEDNIKRTLRNL